MRIRRYFFPGPTALLKALRLLNFWIFAMAHVYFQVWWGFFNITLNLLCMLYVYSRPYVYSFWQVFQVLRLFPALRLFRTLEYEYHASLVWKTYLKKLSGTISNGFATFPSFRCDIKKIHIFRIWIRSLHQGLVFTDKLVFKFAKISFFDQFILNLR